MLELGPVVPGREIVLLVPPVLFALVVGAGRFVVKAATVLVLRPVVLPTSVVDTTTLVEVVAGTTEVEVEIRAAE